MPLPTAVGKSKMTSARLPMDVWMGAPAFTFGRLLEGVARDHVVRYATVWPQFSRAIMRVVSAGQVASGVSYIGIVVHGEILMRF